MRTKSEIMKENYRAYSGERTAKAELNRKLKAIEEAETKRLKFGTKSSIIRSKNQRELDNVLAEIEGLDSLISAKAEKLINRRNELSCYLNY